MIYITSQREVIDFFELNLYQSDTSIYDLHLSKIAIRDESIIGRIGNYIDGYGKHHIIIVPKTASWVLLNDREKKVYCSFERLPFKKLAANYSTIPERNLKLFLKTLYRRGVLTIDDKYPFNSDIYSDELPYHDALLVELLITERCNMDCIYCQADVNQKKRDMSTSVAKATINKAFELSHSKIIFEFSGGEPLLNFNLFSKLISFIEKKADDNDKSVIICLATNGTLLTPSIAKFLKAHKIKLSLSIDGPETIHKFSRPLVGGKSSWQLLQKAIKIIENHGLPYGVMLTISKTNYKHPDEILHFLTKLNPQSVKINPVVNVGRALTKSETNIKSEQYLEFMKHLFLEMARNKNIVREFNLSEIVNRFISKFRDYRCMRSKCNAGITYFVVDPGGNIYPCAQMTGYTHAKLGNILYLEKKLDTLQYTSQFVEKLKERIFSKVMPCCNCEWRMFCQGGCIVERLIEPEVDPNFIHSPTCSFYRGMYEFILKTLSLDQKLIASYLESDSFIFGPGRVVNERII